MDLLPAPLHFAATFLVTVAAFGGTWVTVYRPKFVPDGTVRRICFGLGWLLLALGELLHGSQLASSEQHPVATTLRMAAYVLLVACLQPLVRGKPRDPEALPARPRSAGLPPAGPAGQAGQAGTDIVRPRAPVVPAVRLLILALALFAASEVFFLTVESLRRAQPGTLWLAVHGLRLAGGLAVLAWLGQVVRTSIQARVVAVFIGLMLVVVVALSGSVTQVFTANIAAEGLNRAQREGEVQQRLLETQVSDSLAQGQQVAALDTFRQLSAARSADLEPVIRRLQGPGGAFSNADFMASLDASGALLAVAASGPGNTTTLEVGDVLGLVGTRVVQTALSGQESKSVDYLAPAKLAAIAAVPVLGPDNSGPVGVVVVGRLIDRDYLLAQRPAEGGEAFLISRRAVLESTTPRTDGVMPVGRGNVQTLFGRGARIAAQSKIAGSQYFNSYVPLKRQDGVVIGALVFSARSGVIGLAQARVAAPVFFIALWATVMGVGLSFLFGSRITQPIRDLTEAAERVRRGDLTARVSPKTFDEVGVLGETFDQMTDSLAQLTRELRDTADKELQLRRRLETILQSMTDGVVAVNNQGIIVAFNREAERIFDRRQSEAIGQHVSRILMLRDRAGNPVPASIYELRQGSESGIVDNLRNVSRPVVVTSAPIADESRELLGAVAVVRDLTREVEIEKMKTEFLANISHELRTPITPIKGYSDLMRRKEVPRAQAIGFLEGILASAERLERIVEMLVDFSAMEAGRLSPHKVLVDFDRITADLVDRWAHSSPRHRFERTGFDNIPKVEVDRRLAPLALNELVDNAVKFSPDGGKVTLAADMSSNGRGTVVKISVTDEGIGMGQEQVSRIGDNFVQADGSETRAYGGLGLGLAYVRRIVESHGGRLDVSSRPDQGSCFTLVFPVGRLKGGPAGPAFGGR